MVPAIYCRVKSKDNQNRPIGFIQTKSGYLVKRRFSHSFKWGLSVLVAAVWDAAAEKKLKPAQLFCHIWLCYTAAAISRHQWVLLCQLNDMGQPCGVSTDHLIWSEYILTAIRGSKQTCSSGVFDVLQPLCVGQILKGEVRAGKIDCQAHHQTCQSAGITAYPTVRFYPYLGTRRVRTNTHTHTHLHTQLLF